jgi:acetyltransferase-like isoleucine patch superfamily enzyme
MRPPLEGLDGDGYVREPASGRDILLQILAACIPVNFIDRLLNRVRVAKIKRSLGFCGDRVVISNGLLVEQPQLVSVGSDVSFGPDVSIMGAGGVVIGKGAMLATRTLIVTTQHDPRASSMRQSAVHSKVEIGEFCWIGAGAILLPGVRIGLQAVVGAGAVVTRDVPPYGLAVGVPARTLRDRRTPSADEGVPCHES